MKNILFKAARINATFQLSDKTNQKMSILTKNGIYQKPTGNKEACQGPLNDQERSPCNVYRLCIICGSDKHLGFDLPIIYTLTSLKKKPQ
jgi:hypothetical protein